VTLTAKEGGPFAVGGARRGSRQNSSGSQLPTTRAARDRAATGREGDLGLRRGSEPRQDTETSNTSPLQYTMNSNPMQYTMRTASSSERRGLYISNTSFGNNSASEGVGLHDDGNTSEEPNTLTSSSPHNKGGVAGPGPGSLSTSPVAKPLPVHTASSDEEGGGRGSRPTALGAVEEAEEEQEADSPAILIEKEVTEGKVSKIGNRKAGQGIQLRLANVFSSTRSKLSGRKTSARKGGLPQPSLKEGGNSPTMDAVPASSAGKKSPKKSFITKKLSSKKPQVSGRSNEEKNDDALFSDISSQKQQQPTAASEEDPASTSCAKINTSNNHLSKEKKMNKKTHSYKVG